MAVLMTLEVPGATTDQYDRTNEIARVAEDVPDGLVFHVCGSTGDGLVVADVWDSAEAFERFVGERLGAALAEAGMPEVTPRILPARNVVPGRGTEAGVIMLVEPGALDADAYDRLIAVMDADLAPGRHPAVFHVAATKEDGGVSVVDVWDSRESFERFAGEQVGPAMGGELPPMEPRYVPVHNVIRGSAAATA